MTAKSSKKNQPEIIDVIEVVNIPASKMLGQLKKLGFTIDHSDIPKWDFFKDSSGKDLGYAGKKYEVIVWSKGKKGTTTHDDIFKYFLDFGFDGNIPALIAWILKNNPDGFHTSAPSRIEEIFPNPNYGNRAFTIYFYKDKFNKRIMPFAYPFKCSPGENYLAFREVKE